MASLFTWLGVNSGCHLRVWSGQREKGAPLTLLALTNSFSPFPSYFVSFFPSFLLSSFLSLTSSFLLLASFYLISLPLLLSLSHYTSTSTFSSFSDPFTNLIQPVNPTVLFPQSTTLNALLHKCLTSCLGGRPLARDNHHRLSQQQAGYSSISRHSRL